MPESPRPLPIRPRYKPPPRRSTTDRGYGWEHQRQRERLLRLFPLCQLCGQDWSTDLHHIDGNPGNRDDANVLMVCEACHHRHIHGG